MSVNDAAQSPKVLNTRYEEVPAYIMHSCL